MEWTAPGVTRGSPPRVAGERAMLDGWLDWERQTLLVKCAGLTAFQLKERAVGPSSLSLLGLVRHLAEVERSWFRRRFRGEDVAFIYVTDDSPDADFDDLDTADAEADYNGYLAEVDLARAAAEGRSLNETFVHPRSGDEMSMRWIYLHMIEEYARHNGHADILREQIDGVTGA